MLFLWGFGRYLDRLFTRTQTLAIFLLTGMGGSIFSLAWHPLIISGGASGAIYGQTGVLIALLCFARYNFSRRDIRNLLLWIIFSMPIGLLWGHVSKHTDYADHIGGILCGFGIGVLLARTFLLSPAERAARQRRVWQFAAVPLVILFTIVSQVRRNTVMGYAILGYLHVQTPVSSHHSSRVARIFLDLKGDPGLVRHFTDLLNTELGNSGIAVAGSEHEADGVLRGELKTQTERVNLSMGVVKMYINSNRGLQTIDSCRTLSTEENTNLYEQSAANAVSELRHSYPDAQTVRLDVASDMAASRQFAAEFPSELKTSGLTIVQSGPADIVLYISLLTQKVPVVEDEAAYHLKAVAPDGTPLFESSGSAALSTRRVGNEPAACLERLADLKLIYNNNTLSSIAHKTANDLHGPQAAPHAAKPASKPE
jgi:hypothetical protein